VERVSLVVNLVVGAALMSSLATGQSVTPKIEQWNTIKTLCGTLLRAERHVRPDNGVDEHTRPLKNVALRLYERDDVACCEGKVLADVITGRGGKFSFRDVKPGSYWLVTLVNGREYRMPLRLQSGSDPSTPCSEQTFEVDDSGEFQILKTIRVD
jgi:Prealbumin-like fold domain